MLHTYEEPTVKAEEAIRCWSNTESSFTLEYGSVSILFSFGKPYGVCINDVAYSRKTRNSYTQKHLNNWHNYRTTVRVNDKEFFDQLLPAMASASAGVATSYFQGGK